MGLDLGLEATGRFTTVACIEKESAFCETIRKNRDAGRLSKDLRVLEADISQLDPAAVFENFNIDPQSRLMLAVVSPNAETSWVSSKSSVTMVWIELFH